MEVPTPEGADLAPGARNLVRILLEALRGHSAALRSGDNLVPDLTPQRWVGKASAAFTDVGLPRLAGEWQGVAQTHRLATDRLAGYSTFLQNLPTLWSAYADQPAERARLVELYEQETAKVARDLLTWTAQLDEAGHVEFADPYSSRVVADPVDAEPAEPVGAPLDPPPAPAEVGSADDGHEDPPAEARGPAAVVGRSFHVAQQLREQVLTGERRERVQWTT
jgi:hypothetical protein